eukprot:gene15652-10871_t
MKGAPSCCFLILLAAAVAQGDNCKKPAGQPLPPGQCWNDAANKIAGYDSSPTSEWCCGKCSTTANCTTWVQWRPHNIDDAGSAKVQQTVGMWECYLYSKPAKSTTPCNNPPAYIDVLLIMSDDMRAELGCYGCSHMLPDTSMTWSVVPTEYWRDRGGNFTTLPQYFREHGYLTIGSGKIFHPGAASGNCDVAYSWSAESLPFDGIGKSCPTARYSTATSAIPSRLAAGTMNYDTDSMVDEAGGNAVGAMTPYPTNADTALAACANSTLDHIAARRKSGADTRPFFYAVGFHKPHIPWTVPEEWYELYQLDAIELAPNRNRLYDDTIIMFLGDHGYQLGDNNQWSKVTNFEQ